MHAHACCAFAVHELFFAKFCQVASGEERCVLTYEQAETGFTFVTGRLSWGWKLEFLLLRTAVLLGWLLVLGGGGMLLYIGKLHIKFTPTVGT